MAVPRPVGPMVGGRARIVAALVVALVASAMLLVGPVRAVDSAGGVTGAAAGAVVGGAATPDGGGYWLVSSDGAVTTNGNATFHGDVSDLALNGPVVGVATTPTGAGYWLVASDGGIFAFGDAAFFGSMGGTRLNQPVFSMASSATGRGYWLVARDGGIFSFGDAVFHGSMGGTPLNQPINGISRSVTGAGYRMVARDGGIFSFGDAVFHGSLGGRGISDVVAMATTPSGNGYWILTGGGVVHPFGDARHLGDAEVDAADPAASLFSNPARQGYVVVTASGRIQRFGDAPGDAAPLPSPPVPQPEPGEPNVSSIECARLPGQGTFGDPWRLGTVGADLVIAVGCPGFSTPIGPYFSFVTTEPAGPDAFLGLTFDHDPVTQAQPSPRLSRPDGQRVVNGGSASSVELEGGGTLRGFGLSPLPGSTQPLQPGTWIIGTERLRILPIFVPSFDVVVRVPGGGVTTPPPGDLGAALAGPWWEGSTSRLRIFGFQGRLDTGTVSDFGDEVVIPSSFTWSVSGTTLTITYASGFTERFSLDSYDAAADVLVVTDLSRGVRIEWVGCASDRFPAALRVNC